MLSATWGVSVYIGGETTSADFPTKVPLKKRWQCTTCYAGLVMGKHKMGSWLHFSRLRQVQQVSIIAPILAVGQEQHYRGRSLRYRLSLCHRVDGQRCFPVNTAPPQTYQGGIDAFLAG